MGLPKMGNNALVFPLASIVEIILQDFPFDSWKLGMGIKITTENKPVFLITLLLQQP